FSCIIGPNGAGKSTLFNLLTGHIRADSGRAIFKGEDITDSTPYAICRKGIGRSFQRVNIFPRFTVFENVQTAVLCGRGKALNLFRSADKQMRKESTEILDAVGLLGEKDRISDELAYGNKKRLEFAIALSNQPELLLLDEPTAGMSPDEGISLMTFIRKVAEQRGLTVIFVEHDMSVVFGFATKISVMYAGRMLAEGEPEEIRTNREVQEIYLGESQL
ncbi:ABC transporter ATP-binding protein, partial [bacterium]|nr:ABC transporter ATP-binding protein [bacterium]